MPKKIYINWSDEEYYTSFEEVKEAYVKNNIHTSLHEFLEDNYLPEEVFYFSDEEREQVLKDHDAIVDEEVRDWIYCRLTVVDVEVMFREK